MSTAVTYTSSQLGNQGGWQPFSYIQVNRLRDNKVLGVILKVPNDNGNCAYFKEAVLRQLSNESFIIVCNVLCVSILLPLNLPSSFSLIFIF